MPFALPCLAWISGYQAQPLKQDERELLNPSDELTRRGGGGVRFGPPPPPPCAPGGSSSRPGTAGAEAQRQAFLLPDYQAVERAPPGVKFGPAKRPVEGSETKALAEEGKAASAPHVRCSCPPMHVLDSHEDVTCGVLQYTPITPPINRQPSVPSDRGNVCCALTALWLADCNLDHRWTSPSWSPPVCCALWVNLASADLSCEGGLWPAGDADAEARAELEKQLDAAAAKNRLLPRAATAFFAKSERFADAWNGPAGREGRDKLRGGCPEP